MTHKEKIQYYREALAEVDPPRSGDGFLWEIMWRIGIKIPPQEFINPVVLFIGSTILLFVFFVICNPIVAIAHGDPPATWFILVSTKKAALFTLTCCAIGAGICTLAARSDRQKHCFGNWREFGAGQSPGA